MIKQAVILAAGKGERIRTAKNNKPKPLQIVAGLPLLKRTILTLHQSGVDKVYVVVGYRADEVRGIVEGDAQLARAGVEVEFIDNPDFEKSNGVSLLKVKDHVTGPFILSMADHVYDPSIPQCAGESDVEAADLVLCVDRRVAEVYDPDDATKVATEDGRIVKISKQLDEYDAIDCGVFAIAPPFLDCLEEVYAERGDCSLSDGVQRLAADGRARVVDIGDAFWQDVDTPPARVRAEKELLRRLRKPVDGPVARFLNRYISLAITRVLLPTSMTPNQMTLFSTALGAVGVYLMLQATWQGVAIGGVLLQIQSILDGCDGEIARLKFQGSKFGQWLDHICDDLSTIGFGLAGGWAAAEMLDDPLYWWLSIGGTAGLLCYNAVLSTQLLIIHKSGSPFVFRWWFQKEDAYLKNSLEKGGFFSRVVEVFHSTGRRDVLCFAWMIFALANLPAAIAIWFLVISATHGGLAIIHVFAGGMSRSRIAKLES